MTESLAGAATALRHSAELLVDAGARLTGIDPGAPAFGAGATGRLGEVGRRLHLHLQHCLHARIREAEWGAARLDQVAAGLARAGHGYLDIDHTASRRTPEGA